MNKEKQSTLPQLLISQYHNVDVINLFNMLSAKMTALNAIKSGMNRHSFMKWGIIVSLVQSQCDLTAHLETQCKVSRHKLKNSSSKHVPYQNMDYWPGHLFRA